MRVVFLTTDDPLYLPAFFDTLLAKRGDDTAAVYVVPPLYKGQSAPKAAWRYLKTFGWEGASGLTRRLAQAKLRHESVDATCRRHGVVCKTAADVNAEPFLAELRALEPDLLVSVSCPQLFKESLVALAPLGCINVHGSILPAYRGVMPSFWMLANGEREAGVSIFFVSEKIDGGELCGQRRFAIEPHDTLDTFLRRSKSMAVDLLLEVLDEIEAGTVTRTPLDVDGGSYFSWPDRDAVERYRAAGRKLW